MWAVALLLLASGLAKGSRLDPIVSTNAGVIQGVRTDYGTRYIGIPYGVVDRNNPFGPSTPQPRLGGIFLANQYNACPQLVFRTTDYIGTIDCLTLNVFVPSGATPSSGLPVMVWIHGGGYIEGSGHNEANDPIFLLRNNVIVVSVNYRLGPYGFMCLDIPEVPGNQGLKDQVLALRWVNENIEAFGGDASRITAFGESAGGISVNLHLYSTYEKLFNRAIIQSGPALSPWVMMETDVQVPVRLARELGFNTTDIREALAYLTTVDSETLIRITSSSLIIDALSTSCVEKSIEGVENFLTEHPMNLKSEKIATTELLIGNNNQEAIFNFLYADDATMASFDFNEFVSPSFRFDENSMEALDHLRHFYVGENEINSEVRLTISDMQTDFVWTHATQRMTEQFLDDNAPKVYRYLFSYNGNRNVWTETFNLTITGATHTDELGYLFDLAMFRDDEITPSDQLVIDRLTTLWTNFAKYGDPTPETTELLPVKWEPITRSSQIYLEIDNDIALKTRPLHARMAFWDVFYRLYGSYQIWYGRIN